MIMERKKLFASAANGSRYHSLYESLMLLGNNPEWQIGLLRNLAGAIEHDHKTSEAALFAALEGGG